MAKKSIMQYPLPFFKKRNASPLLNDVPENKYKNKKIIIDGIEFSSKIESLAYLYFKDLLNKGLINNLSLQPKYLLQEGFYKKYYDGKKNKIIAAKHRDINYVADFEFYYKDKIFTIEIKGLEDQKYPIKKKLFLKKYINNHFIEIRNQKQLYSILEILDALVFK